MSDGKVWSDSTSGLLVDIVSEAIKPRIGFLVRGLVKPAVKIVIKVSNQYLSKVVPDSIDGYVNDAIVFGHNGEWDAAAEAIGEAGDVLVDIPGVDDDHEKQLFVSIAQAIVNGVKTWIETKK